MLSVKTAKILNRDTNSGVLYLNKTTGYPAWRDVSGTYEKDVAVFNALVELWFLIHDRKAKQITGGAK